MMKKIALRKKKIPFGKALIMYAVVSLFLFFEMALQVSPSVMSGQLMQALNIGSFGLGIMSGCYFYTYTAMQIPSGILFDRFSPRFVIIISILVCVLGSIFLGIAQNILFACFSRLLMGLGSAFAFVSVLVVTGDLFESKYFATMTGITQMLAAFGAMSGQLPIHLLVEIAGWQRTMFIFSFVGLIVALGVYYFLRYQKKSLENKTKVKKFSSPLYGIKTISSNPQTWFIAVYAMLLWAPMSGFASLWGPRFLAYVDGLSNGTAAFFCSFMWLGLAFASPFLGFISTRMSNRKLPLSIVALAGAISFSIILFFQVNEFYLPILLFIAGGACSGQALSFAVVKENNESSMNATAIAFNNMAVVISGAIFQPLIGWLLRSNNLSQAIQFKYALSVILIAYCAAFLVAAFCIKDPLARADSLAFD